MNNSSSLIQSEPVKGGLFDVAPVADAATSFVYVNAKGEYVVLQSGGKLSRSELLWGKYHTLYRVDVREQTFAFSEELESKIPLEPFRIEIGFNYRVTDPIAFVKQGDGRVDFMLQTFVKRSAGRIANDYESGFEPALRDALYNWAASSETHYKLAEWGLNVYDADIKIRMSSTAEDRLRRKNAMREKVEEELEKQRIEKELNKEILGEIEADLHQGNYDAAIRKTIKSEEDLRHYLESLIDKQNDNNLRQRQEHLENIKLVTEMIDKGMDPEKLARIFSLVNPKAAPVNEPVNEPASLKESLKKKLELKESDLDEEE